MKKEIKHTGDDFIRITTEDERWYIETTPELDDRGLPTLKHFVSQGWVGSYYPKGKYLIEWLKKHGKEADKIRDDKAIRGSKVHQATEDLDAGIKIPHDAKYLNPETTEEEELTTWEYEGLMSYLQFMDANEYEVLAVEKVVKNDDPYFQIKDDDGNIVVHGVAGTCDRVLRGTSGDQELEKGIWVIDIKTGSNQYPQQENQVSFYAHSVDWRALGISEEEWENRRMATLHLNYKYNKRKKWKLNEIEEDKFERFCHVFQLFKDDNPAPKPKQKDYPLYLYRESRLSGERSAFEGLKVGEVGMRDAIAKRLLDAGYETLGDVADDLDGVSDVKGLGPKRIAYIKKVLKAKGVM